MSDRLPSHPNLRLPAPGLAIEDIVEEVLYSTPFIDIHTHLFTPAFGNLMLWGIDELLTYHYLEAELFRSSTVEPARYWSLSKSARADLIWQCLFVENTPLSEATRGVAAVLHCLGLDTSPRTLAPLRAFFREQDLNTYVGRVFGLAGIDSVVMTNDPLDPSEVVAWDAGVPRDATFETALRLDRILNDWPAHCHQIAALGYPVAMDLSAATTREVQRFLVAWSERMQPVYMAVSLPDTFLFPADDARTRLLSEAVLPLCRELDIPLSLMIGVRRQVNPALLLAGDGAGRADLRSVEILCRNFPQNRFLISVLSRENQHELCVYARKFSNLMPFGCWWFLNNPSIVEEITRERLEMLGASFIPQHSDARVLEQVIYKWRNTRRTMATVLTRSYELLAQDGRPVTRGDIERDVRRLFRTNFSQFTRRPAVEIGAYRAG